MADHDAIWDHLDGQQALRLAEVFGLDGWLVEWERVGDAGWEARLIVPTSPGQVVGRGRSRVSAISKAHVEAVRRLRRPDVPEAQRQGPDLGAGIVPLAPAAPVPSS